jgi:hypothetical protein
MSELVCFVSISPQLFGPGVDEFIRAGGLDGFVVVKKAKWSVDISLRGENVFGQLHELKERAQDAGGFVVIQRPYFEYSREEIQNARWVHVGNTSAAAVLDEKNPVRQMTEGECSHCGLPARYLDLPEVDLVADANEMIFKTTESEWLLRSGLLPQAERERHGSIRDLQDEDWSVLREGYSFPRLLPQSTGAVIEDGCGVCGLKEWYSGNEEPLKVLYPGSVFKESGDELVGFSAEWAGCRVENDQVASLGARHLFLKGELAVHCYGQKNVQLDVVHYE